MLLPLKIELILCLKTLFLRERHTSLRCRELCQEDAVLLGNKMKPLVNQKCRSSCSRFAIKTCNIEANTTLSLSKAQPVKIEFHFSLMFIDAAQYFIAKMAALQHISTKLNFPSRLTVFQVLVVYFCLKPKSSHTIHTYIYIYLSLLVALHLIRLKTETSINRCLKILMFYIIQYIKLTPHKKNTHTHPQPPALFVFRGTLQVPITQPVSFVLGQGR